MQIVKPILLGVMASAGALVLETLFSILGAQFSANFSNSLLDIFAFALIEEFLKLSIIYKKFIRQKIAGNIFGSAMLLGTGFSAVEIFFYAKSLQPLVFENSLIFLLLGIFFVHILTSFLAAYFLSRKFRAKNFLLIWALVINVLIHFCYNLVIVHYF